MKEGSGTRNRLIVVASLLLAAGVVTRATTTVAAPLYNEAWMGRVIPKEINGFRMVPGNTGPYATYRMDETTYDKLKPYGIIARQYEHGSKRLDVVTIGGDSADSFHDPTWCLPGQGWTLGERQNSEIEVKGVGKVPIAYFEASNENVRQKMIVAFTFKGPFNYFTGVNDLTLDMWRKEFTTGQRATGAFHRFLGLQGFTSVDEMKPFISEYLAKVRVSSKELL